MVREAGARAAAARGRLEGALGTGAVATAVSRGGLAGSRLVERLRVRDPADEAAVEAALEPHLSAWLVEDLEAATALLCGQEAREEVMAAGLEPLSVAPAPPGARSVLAAVEASEDAAGALSRCLAGVLLVPDLAIARSALAAGARRCVLPDGTVAGAAGIRGGGRPGALTVAGILSARDRAQRGDDQLGVPRNPETRRANRARARRGGESVGG